MPRDLSQYDIAGSPLNELPEVRANARAPATVVLKDCTLREGEQAGNANFDVGDKVEIAGRLSDVGVPLIEVGYVGGSTGDEEAIRAIVAADVSARVEVLVNVYWPSWQDDLRSARELGVDGVAIVTASSPFFVEGAWNTTYELLSDESAEAVSFAAELGLESCLSIADATRSDLDDLALFIRKAASAGADRITLNDSLGVAGPRAVRWLCRRAQEIGDAPIGFHAHNDLGVAVANALAAVESGARQLDVCVNGLGDRVGIAPLDEVAASLLLLDGVDTGVDLEAMLELSRLVARLSGVEVPATKPLVGEHAFSQKLDDHVRSMEASPKTLEALDPTMFGNRRTLVIGRYSGPVSIEVKLRELGVDDLSPDLVAELVAPVRELAAREKRPLRDAELLGIVEEVAAGGQH